ncbi:putative chromatin remodeling & transcription regulator FYR family [Helianthus debilis subsp. tardiflorus]
MKTPYFFLFSQVSPENYPSEVFIYFSPVKCWEMVRERINHEISEQHKLGKANLPVLPPPGSLDGMEMFGFSSPFILQVNHKVINFVSFFVHVFI